MSLPPVISKNQCITIFLAVFKCNVSVCPKSRCSSDMGCHTYSRTPSWVQVAYSQPTVGGAILTMDSRETKNRLEILNDLYCLVHQLVGTDDVSGGVSVGAAGRTIFCTWWAGPDHIEMAWGVHCVIPLQYICFVCWSAVNVKRNDLARKFPAYTISSRKEFKQTRFY